MRRRSFSGSACGSGIRSGACRQAAHRRGAAVEPKGGANVDKETFPATPLPEGKGYGLKQPDQTGRWEVVGLCLGSAQIFVDEGDEVVLEFVGINGAAHPTTISGYDKTFELKRGEVTK